MAVVSSRLNARRKYGSTSPTDDQLHVTDTEIASVMDFVPNDEKSHVIVGHCTKTVLI